MTLSAVDQPRPKWIPAAVVVSAALAMAATLPGRTHGLGLATTRLLSDFPSLNPTDFATINLVATLAGSLFCLPCGWLVDRFGARVILGVVMLALAAAVVGMSRAAGPLALAACVTLSRGLGQSMLSVVSVTMLGKWFRRDAGLVMGGYAVLMTVLLAAATGALAARVSAAGWRPAWLEMGVALAVLAPLAAWLAFPPRRPTPPEIDAEQVPARRARDPHSATLRDALRSGCFWAFAVCIAFFGLVSAGVSLFQQLIFAEQGLPESVFHAALIVGLLVGLAANMVGGWLTRSWSMATLLAGAMFLLAAWLATLPFLRTPWQAYSHAAAGGAAGGLLTLLFFSVWGPAFGPRHLGRIQSAAQMMTVLASAIGPLVVAHGRAQFGSYLPVLVSLAVVAALLGYLAMWVAVPSATRGDWARDGAAVADGGTQPA